MKRFQRPFSLAVVGLFHRQCLCRLPLQCCRRTPYDSTMNRQVPSVAFLGLSDTSTPMACRSRNSRSASTGSSRLSVSTVCNWTSASSAHSTRLRSTMSARPFIRWSRTNRQSLRMPSRSGWIQAWFAGMHSTVGGGYPDDAISHVPLLSIVDNAQRAGLRLSQRSWTNIARRPRPTVACSTRGLVQFFLSVCAQKGRELSKLGSHRRAFTCASPTAATSTPRSRFPRRKNAKTNLKSRRTRCVRSHRLLADVSLTVALLLLIWKPVPWEASILSLPSS